MAHIRLQRFGLLADCRGLHMQWFGSGPEYVQAFTVEAWPAAWRPDDERRFLTADKVAGCAAQFSSAGGSQTSCHIATQMFFREIEPIMTVCAGQRQYCVHYTCGTCSD